MGANSTFRKLEALGRVRLSEHFYMRQFLYSEIAAAHQMRRALGLPGGQLVANPIPAEAEIPAKILAPIIKTAQSDATRHRITGKAVTPYLLQRIYEQTDGKSLTANIALVRNNARLAAKIALSMKNSDV